MADIRTLLDTATAGPPHADPVGAVHTLVRRRTARRRAVAAGGTALAVGATGVAVATRPHGRDTVAAAPTATASPAPLFQWRAGTGTGRSYFPTPDARRLDLYLAQHPDRFALVNAYGTGVPEVIFMTIAVGSDADESAVRAEIGAVAGNVDWQVFRCAQPLAYYDRIAAEVMEPTWPSGTLPHHRGLMGGPPSHDGCLVRVSMPYAGANAADVAYAAQRWGTAVWVTHRTPR
ncbi:MAG TPA: hypothetical protein VFQ85_00375 [Mycobacteriales bacterium]|jgi:hypothetical protein|nr:hypothetical protein [Mycobacteriales bacterium]